MKKLFSIFLIVAMLLGILPFNALFAVSDNNVLETDKQEMSFNDVNENNWFYMAVLYTYQQGIFQGTNVEGTLFSPNRVMSRAELVTTLFRIANQKEADYSGDTGFSDVPENKWMSAPVKWASEKKYVNGVGNGLFDPEGKLNREQLSTMIYRFASDYIQTTTDNAEIFNSFADSKRVSSWAVDAMIWATSSGIINGTGKELAPKMTASRAQVAQVLMNYDSYLGGTDSTGLVDKGLIFTLNNTNFTEPKNVIFMIGDGMGFNIVEAAETIYSDELYNGTFAMNYLPFKNSQLTYSQSSDVTDSAAGGTALATGFKTKNHTIAMNYNYTESFKTTLELAAEKGKSTGVIATKSVTDATPAAFTAHINERNEESAIAGQQLSALKNGTLDLLMGGGRKEFFDENNYSTLKAAMDESQINYISNTDETSNLKLPLLGLFASSAINTHDEEKPTVAEMTDIALDLLSKDENGFFLMVEGSQIDSYAHSNDLYGSAKETYDFDCAVAVVLDFIAKNPDTVLIITADHETGGLLIPSDVTKENLKECKYTTGDHTARKVPVFAIGYGVEELSGIIENTDLAIFVAKLLGEDNFGQKSKLYNLIDGSDTDDNNAFLESNTHASVSESGLKVSYDSENTSLLLPINAFNTDLNTLTNTRALHIEVTNLGDTVVETPKLFVNVKGMKTELDPNAEYIEAGETAVLSYIVFDDLWTNKMFANLKEMKLRYFTIEKADLLIGDIYVTDRGLKN